MWDQARASKNASNLEKSLWEQGEEQKAGVRPEKRGLASGTYYTGFDAGVSAGSILLGAVSQHLGFAVMWPIAAVCTLLGLAGFLADRRTRNS